MNESQFAVPSEDTLGLGLWTPRGVSSGEAGQWGPSALGVPHPHPRRALCVGGPVSTAEHRAPPGAFVGQLVHTVYQRLQGRGMNCSFFLWTLFWMFIWDKSLV